MIVLKFPMVIRKGLVQVKLYHGQNKLGYHSYYVVYYLNRKRKRVVFSDPKKAIAEAKEVADQLDKQEGVVVEFHPNERLACATAGRDVLILPARQRRRLLNANHVVFQPEIRINVFLVLEMSLDDARAVVKFQQSSIRAGLMPQSTEQPLPQILEVLHVRFAHLAQEQTL